MIHIQDLVQRVNEGIERARAAGVVEPTAMTVATVDEHGRPAARILLLKHADEHGFVFYTNLESRKGRHLARFPWASLCFWWAPLAEQIHVDGRVKPVNAAEADAYFASRPRGSQIGAWASKQSDALESRQVLLDRVAEAEARFAGQDVPRPPYWSGFRLIPDRFEFWYGREDRLHERFEYRFEDARWQERILCP